MSMASPPPAAPMAPLPAAAAAMFAYPADQTFARDAILAWYRGEFAAANAIIDTLCNHLSQISPAAHPPGYAAVFNAIHRRRMNWIPVLHMQKYYPIADIALQLRAVAEHRRWVEEDPAAEKGVRGAAAKEDYEINKGEAGVEVVEKAEREVGEDAKGEEEEVVEVEKAEEVVAAPEEEQKAGLGSGSGSGSVCGHSTEEEAKASEEGIGSSAGSSHSQDDHSSVENLQICSDHKDCMTRPEKIKTCKGFTAKEHVKGHMVNVVKGLKMYEDIFKEEELSRLAEFINELRAAGRDGELSGDTFILFNQQLKGNKREIIQLGVPVFQSTKEEVASLIEPIPSILQNVIDHLVQWRLIPESRKPNSCVINFFDEGEHSQPYFKPPHLDNPISTLVLSETIMAFGRALVSDSHGNFRGSLTLPLKEGSLVVMRGNSADMARHVVCPSDNTRVCITFLKVRPSRNQLGPSPPPAAASEMAKAITLWKPEGPPAQKGLCYPPNGVTPTWGVALQAAPILMLVPPRPVVMNPAARRVNRANGTGVFLPWTVGPKKYIKHLPPRIQRRRLHSLALPPPMDMQVEKASRISCLAVSENSCQCERG